MPQTRGIRAEEQEALVAWLDDGLRRGQRGRLEAEYPVSLGTAGLAGHRIVCEGERFASHAMSWNITLCARGSQLPAGLIGLVYTDPDFRGRGNAQACVRACLEDLRASGAWIAALWSDLPEFYARLGFRPAGREIFLGVDPEACLEALTGLGVLPGVVTTGPPRPEDFEALETLYGAHPVRAVRDPGALAQYAACAETDFLVARLAGRPVAYAALGRGDDFRGIIHDWAGSAEGVLACLEALARPRGGAAWLIGPEPHPAAAALRALGARLHTESFALLQLLDAGRLWQRVVRDHPDLATTALRQVEEGFAIRGALGEAALTAEEALGLLFNDPPAAALEGALSPAQCGALPDVLPWPLYLWGFDSI